MELDICRLGALTSASALRTHSKLQIQTTKQAQMRCDHGTGSFASGDDVDSRTGFSSQQRINIVLPGP